MSMGDSGVRLFKSVRDFTDTVAGDRNAIVCIRIASACNTVAAGDISIASYCNTIALADIGIASACNTIALAYITIESAYITIASACIAVSLQ